MRNIQVHVFLAPVPTFHTALFLFESFDNAAVFDAAALDFQSKRSLVVSLLLHIVCHGVCCCLCVQHSRCSERCSAQVGVAFSWWVRHFAFFVFAWMGHIPTCGAKHIVQSLADWVIGCHKCSCWLVIFECCHSVVSVASMSSCRLVSDRFPRIHLDRSSMLRLLITFVLERSASTTKTHYSSY